jgi:hypothetical protein
VPVTLSEASEALLACVEDALTADLRPVCRAYHAVGTPVIATCCECEDGSDGELSVHFRRIFDADAAGLDEVRRVHPCRGGVIAAQFRIVLARCIPVIDDHGQVPAPELVTEKAHEQMTDANLMWRALTCCPDLRLRVDDISVDLGPMGGCSIVFADVTVEVRVPAPSA